MHLESYECDQWHARLFVTRPHPRRRCPRPQARHQTPCAVILSSARRQLLRNPLLPPQVFPAPERRCDRAAEQSGRHALQSNLHVLLPPPLLLGGALLLFALLLLESCLQLGGMVAQTRRCIARDCFLPLAPRLFSLLHLVQAIGKQLESAINLYEERPHVVWCQHRHACAGRVSVPLQLARSPLVFYRLARGGSRAPCGFGRGSSLVHQVIVLPGAPVQQVFVHEVGRGLAPPVCDVAAHGTGAAGAAVQARPAAQHQPPRRLPPPATERRCKLPLGCGISLFRRTLRATLPLDRARGLPSPSHSAIGAPRTQRGRVMAPVRLRNPWYKVQCQSSPNSV